MGKKILMSAITLLVLSLLIFLIAFDFKNEDKVAKKLNTDNFIASNGVVLENWNVKEIIEERKIEEERLEKERLENERLEKERLEKERLEKERLEKERLEKERLEKERLEKERLEKDRLEKERIEKENIEKQRLEKEKEEKERIEKEKKEIEVSKKSKPVDEKEKTVSKVFIPVKKIMQKPELPNGCEITSLTSILNYYGYNVSKTTMADNYLPKEPFTYEGDKRFAPNPYKAYVGDPRLQPGGWYSFAPPIVTAANSYANSVGANIKAKNISGSSKEDIIKLLDQGIPVVMWTTLDMSAPRQTSHWYLNDTGEYYKAYVNLHVTVLNGYEGNKVHVMNPLVGQVTYSMDSYFNSYYAMGKHAMIVTK